MCKSCRPKMRIPPLMCEQCGERRATWRGLWPPRDGKSNFCDECFCVEPLDMDNPEHRETVKNVIEQINDGICGNCASCEPKDLKGDITRANCEKWPDTCPNRDDLPEPEEDE